MDALVLIRIDQRDAIALKGFSDFNLITMHDWTNNFRANNLGWPRVDVLSVIRFHNLVDETEHLCPSSSAISSNHRVISIIMTRRNNRTIVTTSV